MNLLQSMVDHVTWAAIVQNVGWLLIHSIWQCLLIVLVALCIAKVFWNRSSAARYWLYSLSLMLTVMVPIVTVLAFPQTDIPSPVEDESLKLAPVVSIGDLLPIEEGDGQSIPVVATQEEDRVAASDLLNDVPADEPASEPITASYSNWIKVTLSPWLSTIVTVWCCGVLLFSIRPVWGWLMVRRLLRVCTSSVATHVQEALHRVCEKMKVRRRVEVLASTLVGSPIVVGCFRSVILVPASFVSDLPVSQIEAILAHELAHVRRFDYLVNLLQTLVETLFFYHPAVWWLSYRIRVERENCCDDLVVTLLGNKVEYGRALLAIEEFRSRAATSLALSAKGGSLLARVKRLLTDASGDPQRGSFAWITLGVLFIALAITAWVISTAYADADTPQDDDGRSKTFVAQVTDEISVELLAVQPFSGEQNKPWKPNGRAFDTAPELPASSDTAGRFKQDSRNLFIRWKGLDKSVGLTYRLPGGRLFLNPDESGIARIVAEPADAGNVVTVRVGITDADWGPWQKVGKDGKIIEPATIPSACRDAYGAIKPDHIEERVNSCLFCWTGLKGVDSNAQFDLVAITTDGKQQKYDGRTAWDGPGGTESAEVFNIPLNNIDHFEYRLRPFRHWASFENVSLQPGNKTDVKISVEKISMASSATRAGRWQITDNTELEITQKLIHAADVMTTGVIRMHGDKDHPRHVSFSIAVDYFANRVRWKAVWEEGQPVLWSAKGLGDGPGRILPPGTKAKIEELRRIDFRNPECIVHHVYDGWVANQLPSADIQAALEEEFGIKADGQEHGRYYETARPGLQPDDSTRQLSVWVGENGDCQVQNLAWAPNTGEPEHLKCQLTALPETLALVVKKFRDKKGGDVPIHAFITARPELPADELRSVIDACQQGGLIAPSWEGTATVVVPESKEPNPVAITLQVLDRDTWYNDQVAAVTRNDTWLRFCPGTEIVEHTDATFVSGVVVDETGKPISNCSVEHPGIAGPKTDAEGRFEYKQSSPHRTVLRIYHPEYRLWHGAPQLGDVLRVVLQKKPTIEAVDGQREMTVRVIDSRTAEPVPNVMVTATCYEGPKNGQAAATATTNEDGTVVLRGLDFIQHMLTLSADQPIPYIPQRDYPLSDRHEAVMLVDRACELILRAVDSETGKGIAGVAFDRERALAELWAEPVRPDILGASHVENNTDTDADGYFRCFVGPATWSYLILKPPAGYDGIVPIDGRQDVEIATPVGGKVEYTFRLVKKNLEPAAGERSDWHPRRPNDVVAGKHETAELLADHSVQMSLPSPDTSAPVARFTFAAATEVSTLRLELLPDTRFEDRRLGRMPNRTLKLFEVKPWITSADGSTRTLEWAKCSYLQNPDDAEVSSLIDHATDTGWTVPPLARDQSAHELTFQLTEPLNLEAGDTLAVELDSGGSDELDTIARFRVSFPSPGNPGSAERN